MIFRSVAILVLLGLLWAFGLVDLGGLPWHSPDFRVGGATVLVYLAWSAWESRYRKGPDNLPYLVFYGVLLVSALDGFLLELTTWSSPWILRWAGLAMFTAGCILRGAAYSRESVRILRYGRVLQLAGLPVALGSIAGTVVALAAGIPGSIHEELGPATDEEEQ